MDPITKGSDVMQTNVDIFKAELIKQYHNLKDDPEYIAVFSKMTPEDLAEKMIPAFIRGSANKDGKGIQRTCKALGVKHTYKGIAEFLKEGV